MAFVDVLTFIIEVLLQDWFYYYTDKYRKAWGIRKKKKKKKVCLKFFMQIHHISHFNPSGNVDCLWFYSWYMTWAFVI